MQFGMQMFIVWLTDAQTSPAGQSLGLMPGVAQVCTQNIEPRFTQVPAAQVDVEQSALQNPSVAPWVDTQSKPDAQATV